MRDDPRGFLISMDLLFATGQGEQLDVSREVPAAMEPLAQLMVEDETP